MPLLFGADPLSYRMGFGSAVHNVAAYRDFNSMKAGWYLDWAVNSSPLRPQGMEYAQMVRVHQKLSCPPDSPVRHDRGQCPYAQPLTYEVWPGSAAIADAARKNPGSLWLIGNEMERRDWPGGGQDEILPETYAIAYHDLYYLIKSVDPKAQVAIGGVIQATPIRLEYLSRVWDSYHQQFGTWMPVDVWNVHNFIMRESFDGHGAGVPAGIGYQPAATYADSDHVNMGLFDAQIQAFRRWMRDRGQQNKPLIVTEYGVLYHHIAEADTPQEVQAFMLATFDYFLNAQDCNLGYPQDECRLVQRWAWYSLDDSGAHTGFNAYTALFDPTTRQITGTGAAFRNYSLANRQRLAR